MRDKLYIYTEEPTHFNPNIKIIFGYKETCEALTNMQHEIHTLQISFLSHFWIKFGYDIHLVDGPFEIVFDEKTLGMFPKYGAYHMMYDMYNTGVLYQKPE